MINPYWEPLAFAIQSGRTERWLRVIDTSRDSPDDFLEFGVEEAIGSSTYVVQRRLVVVLLEG